MFHCVILHRTKNIIEPALGRTQCEKKINIACLAPWFLIFNEFYMIDAFSTTDGKLGMGMNSLLIHFFVVTTECIAWVRAEETTTGPSGGYCRKHQRRRTNSGRQQSVTGSRYCLTFRFLKSQNTVILIVAGLICLLTKVTYYISFSWPIWVADRVIFLWVKGLKSRQLLWIG